MKRLLGLAALALAMTAGSAHADDPLRLSLESTTPLQMASSDTLLVSGVIASSASGAEVPPAVLFDLEAGGLESEPLAERDHRPGVARFRATRRVGSACAAAGIASPCLVPRLSEYAHEQLMTTADFRRTLSGTWTVEILHASPEVVPAAPRASFAAPAVALGVIAAAAAAMRLRRRKRTPLGDVYAAALIARKATRGDLTLAVVRTQIDELVARAEMLEAGRIESRGRLAAIDRTGLERKREAWARSPSPDAPDAIEWVTAELAEAARAESDLASSLAGLDRIAAALRVLTLRSRQHRGAQARASTADPVDALASELDRREAALREVSRI
jgi:hypothetical protein